jgi:hypothetical protein
MSVTVYFLDCQCDCVAANLDPLVYDEGKGSMKMERRYQGRWNVSKMADCRWMLQLEVPGGLHEGELPRLVSRVKY